MVRVATLLTLAYGTRVEDAYDRRMTQPAAVRAPPKALAPTHRSSREPGRTVSVTRHGITWLRPAPGPVLEPVWLLPERELNLEVRPLPDNTIHTPVSFPGG